MAEGGAIQVPVVMHAGSVPGAVDKVVGSLTRMVKKIGKVNAVLGIMTAGFVYFAQKGLRKATQEAIVFQTEMAELTKLLGPDAARPLAESIADLSKVMPLAREELNEVAATAARLGIRGTANITEFTRVMAMMGVATDVSATQAADALARVALQTGTPVKDMEKVGSAINQLSNTMATSSSQIIESVRRSAPELARFGLSVDQIIALSAAINTVSESAPRAGTRLRMLFQSMQDVDKVTDFAEAVGKSATEFELLRKEDPARLVLNLIEIYKEGGDAANRLSAALDARSRLALAALAQIYESLDGTFKDAAAQMEYAISLQEEYNRFAGIITAKQQILTNRIRDTRREIGENMLPVVDRWMNLLLDVSQVIGDIVDEPLEGLVPEGEIIRMERLAAAYLQSVAAHQRLVDEQGKPISAFGALFRGGEMQDPELSNWNPELLNRMIADRASTMEWYGKEYTEFAHTLMGAAAETNDALTREFGAAARSLDGFTSILEFQQDLGTLERSLLAIGTAMGDVSDKNPELMGFVNAQGQSFQDLNQRLLSTNATYQDILITLTSKTGAAVDLATSKFEKFTQTTKGAELVTTQQKDAIEELKSAVSDLMREYEGKEPELIRLQNNEEYQNALTNIARLQEKKLELAKTNETLSLSEEAALKGLINFRDQFEYWLAEAKKYIILTEQQRAATARLRKELKNAAQGLFQYKTILDLFIGSAKELNSEQNAINSMVQGMLDEMGKLSEIDKVNLKYEEFIKTIDGFLWISDEVRDSLKELAEEWRNNRIEFAKTEDLREAEAALERLRNRMDFTTMQGKMRLFERIIEGLTDSTLDFFEAMVTGSEKAGEAFISMIQDIARELLRWELMKFFLNIGLKVADPLGSATSAASSVGSASSVASDVSTAVDGFTFAEGGQLPANRIALVGEEGPELFVPEESDATRKAMVERVSPKTIGGINNTVFEVDRGESGDQKARVVNGRGKVVGKDGIIVGESGPELIYSEVPGKVVTAEQTPTVARAKETKESDVSVEVSDRAVEVATPDVDVDTQAPKVSLDGDTPDIDVRVEPSAEANVSVPDVESPNVETIIEPPNIEQPAMPVILDTGDEVAATPEVTVREVEAPSLGVTSTAPDAVDISQTIDEIAASEQPQPIVDMRVTRDAPDVEVPTVDAPEAFIDVSEPEAPKVEVTRDTPEPVNVTIDAPEPVSVTPDMPEPVDITPDMPEPVSVTTETPEPVSVATEMPEPVSVTAETPEPVYVTAETPEPVSVTTEAPEPVDVTATTPEIVSVIADTPEPVDVTADVPEPVSVVTETPEPVIVTTETPEPVNVATAAEAPEPVNIEAEAPEPVSVVAEVDREDVDISMPDVEQRVRPMIEVTGTGVQIAPEVPEISAAPAPREYKQSFGDAGKTFGPTRIERKQVYVDVEQEYEQKERAKRVDGRVVPRDYFPKMMASGGKIDAEQIAIVGEKGPELFVPDVGGTIVPNNRLNSVGRGEEVNITVSNNFTIQALDGADVKRVLAKEKDFISGMTLSSIDKSRILKQRSMRNA